MRPGETAAAAAPELVAERLLKRHSIEYSAMECCEEGHTNQVVMVDRRYIVRWSSTSGAARRLTSEARLYAQLQDLVPTPRILHWGELGGLAYQIRRYVPGDTLAACWADLTPRGKQSVCEQLAAILQTLHAQVHHSFGYLCAEPAHYANFRAFKSDEFEWLMNCVDNHDKLRVPPELTAELRVYFRRHSGCFSEREPCRLVHNDLWLGNVLVDDGRISALIDLELAQKGPPDAELYKIDSFCARPEMFSRAPVYSDFPDAFRRAYPALFACSGDPSTRLNLYELISTWRGFLFEASANAGPAPSSELSIELSSAILGGTPRRAF
jgi:aminoglycoside phosphotransferase (APT) family kinase protein